MSAPEMFKPGTKVQVITDESLWHATMYGWCQSGVIVEEDYVYTFIPFAQLEALSVDKSEARTTSELETSHA